MANKKGCCEDRHLMVKTEKKYSVPVTPGLLPELVVQQASFIDNNQLPVFPSTGLIMHAYAHAPPGKARIPLFIRHCAYLI